MFVLWVTPAPCVTGSGEDKLP